MSILQPGDSQVGTEWADEAMRKLRNILSGELLGKTEQLKAHLQELPQG